MPIRGEHFFNIATAHYSYSIGSVINVYPDKNNMNYMLTGGTWLAIQFPPHNTEGMIVAKIEYTGSADTSITSAMGIVPGNHLFRKDCVGLAMCLRIQ